MSLPGWLERQLPEPREPVMLSRHGSMVWGGDESLTFATVDDACEHLTEHGFMFDQSLDPDGYGVVGQWVSCTDTDRLQQLEDEIKHVQENAIMYEAQPGSFWRAYVFLDGHPAFWEQESKFVWCVSGHADRMLKVPLRGRGDDSLGWSIEHESTGLSAHGTTIQEAIIQLAGNVHAAFKNDGTPRSDTLLPQQD